MCYEPSTGQSIFNEPKYGQVIGKKSTNNKYDSISLYHIPGQRHKRAYEAQSETFDLTKLVEFTTYLQEPLRLMS
jgi:hypothetical protein